MGGREKQKQYQYSKDGKFIRDYESLSEVVNQYNLTKGTFYIDSDARRMEDETWICKKRLGEKAIMRLERIYNCPFCKIQIRKSTKPLEVFNLKGEKLAEFSSEAAFEKMTGLPRHLAWTRANGKGNLSKNDNNLVVKYKESK